MNCYLFFCAVIAFQTAAIATQRLETRGQGITLRHKRASASKNNTCTEEELKKPTGAILKRRKQSVENDSSTFLPGEEAVFVCKDGYRLQNGQLKSYTCKADGNWTLNAKNKSEDGFCQKDPCGARVIDVTGRATGVLTSDIFQQSQSDAIVNCSWTLKTQDPGFYIKLLFENFTLPEDCTQDFVTLEKVRFWDFKNENCPCEESKSVCRFSGKHAPSLSRSVTNETTVNFYSSNPAKSYFKAIWFNVNGLFPEGVVPAPDPTESPEIVNSKLELTTAPESNTSFTVALILFTLIFFVIGVVLACKVGQRYLGPSCSFGAFFAWISSLRTSQAPLSTQRGATSSEERGLMTDTDSPLVTERVVIRGLQHSPSTEDESSASSRESLQNVV